MGQAGKGYNQMWHAVGYFLVIFPVRTLHHIYSNLCKPPRSFISPGITKPTYYSYHFIEKTTIPVGNSIHFAMLKK